jgi:ATP-dependent Clp protease ATP-binding subunit ClpA
MALMRFDKFTFKAQEAIQQAQKLAEEREHQAIDIEHLLLALVNQTEDVVQPILRRVGQPQSLPFTENDSCASVPTNSQIT